MSALESDQLLSNSAFQQVQRLEMIYGDEIPWHAIEEGIQQGADKVYLANRARGIFKPRQMHRGLLSIKTTEPRAGRTNIYSDQETDEGFFRYSLQRGDPHGGGNKHLWEALEDQTPFIYLYAVAEGVYKAIWPCFVTVIHPDQGFCEVVVGNSVFTTASAAKVAEYSIPETPEQRYSVRETKVRLHQATFRKNVLNAYNNRCAISGLPIVRLLDAAHITPDSELDSSTEVTNGIAMSRLHHQAFDAGLLGISPDWDVILSNKVLDSRDGPLLEVLKNSHNTKLTVPVSNATQPDRQRLSDRFEQFLELQ
jgi:putative restriction endonuclease